MSSDRTFYTCIESGRLEPEVVLMAASLRAFGGRFARCPVLAVRTRHGPRIAPSMLRAPEQLEVRHVDAPQHEAVEVLRCVEKPGPVSTGEGVRIEPFWAAPAKVAGLVKVPFVRAGPSGKRIRPRINSGVFRFAPGSGFAQRYRQTYGKLMALRIAPKDDPSIFLHQQILFPVAAASWQRGFALFAPQPCGDAVLMHWHGALRRRREARFMRGVRLV